MTRVGPLASLIGEASVSDFLTGAWGRDVAHYPGQLPADSEIRVTLERFEAALGTLNRAHEGWLHLAEQGLKALPPSFADAEGMLDMERLGVIFGAGHTLYLTKAERIIPPLTQLCAGLADELASHGVPLRSKINAHVFLTPPQSQGLAPHRDEHASFILQMEGAKEWTIYAPQAEVDRHQSFQPGAVEMDVLRRHRRIDVRLEAGDVLYMPEWWPHEARAAAAHSLHVTIRIFPLRWVDLLQHLSATTASLAAAIPAATVMTPGGLAAELGRMLRDPALLDGVAMPAVAGSATWSRPGVLREVLRGQALTLDTHLVRADGVRCEVHEHGDYAALNYPGGTIRGPCAFLPVFRFIAATDGLSPSELPCIALDYDRLEVARRLVGGGLMRIDDGPP